MIQNTARWHHLTSQEMIGPAREAYRDLQRRRALIRSVLPELDVLGRSVVLVSQGVGTGAKMLGAIASVRDRGASHVIAAAPAGTSRATWQLHDAADTVVIPHRPASFRGVDRYYREYITPTEDTVREVVERWVRTRPEQQPSVKTIVMRLQSADGKMISCEVDLPPGTTRDAGPYPAVIYAHALHSDCRSPRNVPISFRLSKRGVIGVRLDFVGHGRSEGEFTDCTPARMLDDLRLVLASVRFLNEVRSEKIGICGAGAGAAGALRLAAEDRNIASLVVRSPDAMNEPVPLKEIRTPTLLIHAEDDIDQSDMISTMDNQLAAPHVLIRVPDSDRLFRDPVSRELMVSASVDWLYDHLIVGRVPAARPLHETDEEVGNAS